MFLSLVAAMLCATAIFAQSSMLATLSHNGKISTYYGASALSDAYKAADNGDIITLSSGSFNAVNLEKAITIRGAGMAIDSTAQTEPTILMGDFNINIPDTIDSRLTLEGLYHNLTITITGDFKNGTFLKDRFNKISFTNKKIIKNLTMIHCKVSNQLLISGGSSVSCLNSYINNPTTNSNGNFEFVNCIIYKYNFGENEIGKSSFKNSFLYSDNGYGLSSSAVAYNCVGIGLTQMFSNIPNTTNSTKSFNAVFKSYTGTFNDNENFELTDEAKSTLKGIDGTQIGIYGGNMPFSTIPTNPQITKCNVAAKSTADGKLSVDITVNGAE